MLIRIVIFVLLLSTNASAQRKVQDLLVDPKIQWEVEKRINPPIKEFADINDMSIYTNLMDATFFEEDTTLTITAKDSVKRIFKCFHFKRKDTIGINGAYGMFGGMGFYIKIANYKAQLYHMLAADDYPYYAYSLADSAKFRLEVPCKNSVIILSKVPNFEKGEILYGYVEFESLPYYSIKFAPEVNGKKVGADRRIEHRANMKIYFKSTELELF